jgi:hypothetical protein
VRTVVHDDEGLGRGEPVLDLFDQRQKIDVEQYRRCARIVEHVGDVVRCQADVDRLKDGAHHGHSEIALVVAVAVPIEDGDHVALFDADLGQSAGEAADTLAEGAIGPSPDVAVHDFLIGRSNHWRMEQMLDEQRIGISRRRRLDDLDRHELPPRWFYLILTIAWRGAKELRSIKVSEI